MNYTRGNRRTILFYRLSKFISYRRYQKRL